MSGETRREAKRMAREARLRQRSPQLVNAEESESHRVFLWRLKCLEQAGMPRELAKRVADSDFDLHTATDMLAANCPHETLLTIALPL